jgi:HTH-type transcriptional regulator/antitoxin HigA
MDYAGLCRVLLPRPIRDAVDYANVVEVTDAMVLWHDEFTRDQDDYFDLLCSLIEEYDAKNVKWPKVSGLDALKHLLDAQDLGPADLSRLLGGSRNLGAMILRGERKLTLKHVRTLARRFRVSADLFLD